MNDPTTTNPYASPSAELADVPDSHKPYGGLRRLPYFCLTLLAGLFQNILLALAVRAMTLVPAPTPRNENGILAFTCVGLIGLIVGIVYATSRRLVNIGSNPWWCLGLAVPLLNLFIFLRCVVCPEGYDDHKTLDSIARGMIGCFIGLLVMFLVAVLFTA